MHVLTGPEMTSPTTLGVGSDIERGSEQGLWISLLGPAPVNEVHGHSKDARVIRH